MKYSILFVSLLFGLSLYSQETDSTDFKKDSLSTKNEAILDRYPVFRGCSETLSNAELEQCSKKKIMNFIKMSYDLELASYAMPTARSTKFLVEFEIDKKGKIKNVNAKAQHKAIAIEAIKVVKRLPKFKKPGSKNGVPVSTPFSLLMTIYFN